ncbi:uncharacterized protein [Asterias amurensis]|uniref:uncharacterized protein n=1 Tax=Asterias amurensis TaxID=7602 RepID=UPI003AB8DD23
MGKKIQYFSVNAICNKLKEPKCRALPPFHAFTGSDTTSQFLGKGKKSAWEAWNSFPGVSEAFVSISQHPFEPLEIASPDFQLLERFTCVLYDKTSPVERVNELREELFSKAKHTMEKIPPTQAALLQHSNRALYQASIWTTSLKSEQRAPLPEGYGWTKVASDWKPVWSLIPEAASVCRELLKCGCQTHPQCSRNCKCRKAGLSCTALCKCGGSCQDL